MKLVHLPWLDDSSIVTWEELERWIGLENICHIGLNPTHGRKSEELLS